MQPADWLQARGLAYRAPTGEAARPPEEHAGAQAALPPGELERAPVRWLTSKAFGFLFAAAVALEAAVVEPFRALTQMDKLDLTEVCDTKESRLAKLVLEVKGCAERDSTWNGFYLSTTEGTNRFAPSCDLWSSAQNLNPGDSARLERLRMKRMKSKRIFRNGKRVMSEYLEPEPTAEVVGDQPRRAKSWNHLEY